MRTVSSFLIIVAVAFRTPTLAPAMDRLAGSTLKRDSAPSQTCAEAAATTPTGPEAGAGGATASKASPRASRGERAFESECEDSSKTAGFLLGCLLGVIGVGISFIIDLV